LIIMVPSDMISVQLFKSHLAERLDRFKEAEDAQVLHVLRVIIVQNLHDSALFLQRELHNNDIDFQEVLEHYYADLADHYVQDSSCSDSIIEQLLSSGNSCFLSKIDEAKELQLAIARLERKRLKELLIAHDEQQELEDINIAFERIERQALKKQLQDFDNGSISAASEKRSSSFGMFLRIAAILIVVIVPVGIILFRNMSETGSTNVADSGGSKDGGTSQIVASEDISGLLSFDLPAEEIIKGVLVVSTDDSYGYAQEDEEIIVKLVSKKNQLDYLGKKKQELSKKLSQFEQEFSTISKTGEGSGPKTMELKKQIKQLEESISKCSQLENEILSKEMYYEFTGKELKIFTNDYSDPKRFSVETQMDEETATKQYYLFLDGKEYTKLIKNRSTK
jgi:hypothetical protein